MTRRPSLLLFFLIFVIPQLQSFEVSPIGYTGSLKCEGSDELSVEWVKVERKKKKVDRDHGFPGRSGIGVKVSMITDRTQRTNLLDLWIFG